MKSRLIVAMSAMILLVQAAIASAQSTTFTVSATIPNATAVSITASRVVGTTFTPVSGTLLSFDPMTFNTANSIWLPDHYFAIDVGVTGGPGTADTTVTYTEVSNPNAPGTGLGARATATFVRVAGTTETVLPAHGKKRLLDLNGERILPSEVSGGFLRTYVGIVTKDPNAVPLDPANSVPFTNADAGGVYSGSLVFTATAA